MSAWATANKLVLGQVKVDCKSNEITAIPELIKVLELSGCIVTIDAIGCQKEIVKLIVNKEADYIITLKKNQGNLHTEVEQLFKDAISNGFDDWEYSTYKNQEMSHGRQEIRRGKNLYRKCQPEYDYSFYAPQIHKECAPNQAVY